MTASSTTNLFNGAPSFALAASGVTVSSHTITVDVAATNLPSTGRSFGLYGWNLWPRGPGISGNAATSDFAPDAGTPRVASAVPEPASVAPMLAGAPAVPGVARRRRRVTRLGCTLDFDYRQARCRCVQVSSR